jgi:hypothetical protein
LAFSESIVVTIFFATGAGAMLQAVIYGFGGVEQTDNGLKFNKDYCPQVEVSEKIMGWC